MSLRAVIAQVRNSVPKGYDVKPLERYLDGLAAASRNTPAETALRAAAVEWLELRGAVVEYGVLLAENNIGVEKDQKAKIAQTARAVGLEVPKQK